MKVRVIKDFRDKYTKKLHKAGQELEITQERYEEINSTAHGCFVEQIQESKQYSTKEIAKTRNRKTRTKSR